MDDALYNAQKSNCWFERHTQLLSQHGADATQEELGNKLSTSNEVIITNYFWNGHRIYMRNAENIESRNFPRSYDFMACGHQTVNLKRLIGHEAIVYLKSGQLVVRVIRKSNKRNRIDLYDHYQGSDPIITLDADAHWAAPVCGCMPCNTWDDQVAHGCVKILRDLHWSGDAGQVAAG